MHDIRWIRDNREAFDAALERRSKAFAGTAERLIARDEARRKITTELQGIQERRNAASKEIGQAKGAGDEARANALMAEVAGFKERMPELEEQQRAADKALHDALAEIPNLPLDAVPEGPDETANRLEREVGTRRDFGFDPKQHFEIGEALGLMDFETAAKLSGSRFVVLKGALARLERALGAFMLDIHTGEHGYQEVAPPLIVFDDVMFGTGQLPKFKEDQFIALSNREEMANVTAWGRAFNRAVQEDGIPIDDFDENRARLNELHEEEIAGEAKYLRRWLIPTAEVPLTNLVRDDILDASALPIRVTAFTPCFRAEAGAAGKDTRGMIRQHQFSKVELVSITAPEESRDELERMTACAEEVLKRLELPYRVVTLSTGDMGFAARKTYDIEVWLPGQGAYREISSCSVCGDFQARRMNARYRPADSGYGQGGFGQGPYGGRLPFVHTLNGSGVAVGRALIAVLENFQEADGSVTIPEALRPYMGGVERIASGE